MPEELYTDWPPAVHVWPDDGPDRSTKDITERLCMVCGVSDASPEGRGPCNPLIEEIIDE